MRNQQQEYFLWATSLVQVKQNTYLQVEPQGSTCILHNYIYMYTRSAKEIRDKFKDYFCSLVGELIPQQHLHKKKQLANYEIKNSLKPFMTLYHRCHNDYDYTLYVADSRVRLPPSPRLDEETLFEAIRSLLCLLQTTSIKLPRLQGPRKCLEDVAEMM